MKKIFLFILSLGIVSAIYASSRGEQVEPCDALKPLQEQADSGNLNAMYRLSIAYENGIPGCAPDTAAAIDLLHKSAMGGYAPAMNYLGYCYGAGHLGLRRDADSALWWIEKAAAADVPDPKAFNNLGAMLLYGELGVQRDYAKARYWLSKGAEAGVATSAAMLAKVYLQGLDIEPDTTAAIPLLRQGARAGILDAALELADIILPQTDSLPSEQLLNTALPYYHERITPVAIPLIERAANADVPLAVAILAQCTAEGIGVDYDYDRAVELYARAAALGEPHAQYILAETLQALPDLLASRPELVSTLIGHEECDDTDTATLSEILYARAAHAGITDAAKALQPLRPNVLLK
ncbi:MAG: sel1 repeat family protein [Lachnospiraceae bacterium]|nr:sel1 repeat family protein [Prevotella sp.]MCM1075167.1 sel1 repeat family protein [Ruminococcus sp.]MCM1225104.1 sel1 repeat family protein [Lachnospiraceae bacterium]